MLDRLLGVPAAFLDRLELLQQRVGRLGLLEGADRVLELTAAREVSLANKALETLSDLAMNGNRDAIIEKLKARLRSGGNQYHREKLNKLLENIEKHQAKP